MSQIIKTYSQLPPKVKQAINNTAANAARAAVNQVRKQATLKANSQARSRTSRTRNGMRIYSPNDMIETKSFAPVSFATSWTSGNKSLRVHQTEVIGRVSANSTWFPSWNNNYSVATFPINPANPRSFPWLSYIARLYDKYRFYKLRFIYVNSVSTQQEGNVMMSLDYDTLDAAPANLVQASQLAKYKLTPIYYPADFSVPVTHPGNNQWLYTFDLSATSSTVDLKTYNLGNFFLALDGVPQDGKDYGYLAVEYDVELLDKNPITADSVFASLTYDSAAAAAKRDRSNVDPADTMQVTTVWETPSADTGEVPLTINFSEDVPVGAKARLTMYVNCTVKNSDSSQHNVTFSTPVVPDNCSVLTQRTKNIQANANTVVQIMTYLALDIEVPSNRSVTLTMRLGTYGKFNHTDTDANAWYVDLMSYTYA
jgi:hypothetical protein